MNYTLRNHIAYIPTSEYINKYWEPDQFIKYCKTCKNYQTSWACPSFDYNPKDIIDQYKHSYIIGTQVIFTPEYIEASKDQNIDTVSQQIMKEVRAVLDQQLLKVEQAYKGSLALFAGNCHWCPDRECTRVADQPCRHPELIRPSLEAYGFDIGQTTSKLLKLELKWGKDGTLPPYFILVSGMMSRELIPNLEQLIRI